MLILTTVVTGCGALGLSAPCPGWGDVTIAYHTHTTRMLETLYGTRVAEMSQDAELHQTGELWVSADTIPMSRAPGVIGGLEPPLRQWCFRPDGSDQVRVGGVREDWHPPNE